MRGKTQRISYSSSRCLKHGVLAFCDRRTPMLYAVSPRSSQCCNTMFSFSSVVNTSQSRTVLLKSSRTRVTVWYRAWNLWKFYCTCRYLPLNVDVKKVKKVKCTLVQALRLCTGRTAHRGSRGITLLFYDHGTRWGWGVSLMPRPLFTPGKDPVPIVQEAGWAPGPVWTGAENLVPTGIRSPDRPARSQSQYRLRYPAYKCGR